MPLYINRSKDFKGDVTWIVSDFDADACRSRGLYAGNDVNEAVRIAVVNGAARKDCFARVKDILARGVNDTLTEE